MQLVGVSFPRAGHHFLVRLLAAVLPDKLSYCEFYSPIGCCRAVPCTRSDAGLRLQKNHDFELNLSTELPDCWYVIQHREPVGAAVSDREFYVRVEGAAVGASHEDYEVWLARKAAHFVGFHRRWLRSPTRNSICIDYADLSANPADVVTRLLADVGVTPDHDAARAAARLAKVGDFGVADGWAARPLEQRSGFQPDLLARYESLIIDELPELATSRLLPHVVRDTDNVFDLAYVAASAEFASESATAIIAIDRGLTISPRHPLLLDWRGQLAWRSGDLAFARRLCEQAVVEFPDHSLLRVNLAQVAYAQGDFATARTHAEAIRRLRQPDAGHEVLLAMILAALHDHDTARAQIATTRAARPTEPSHWAYLVHAAIAIQQTSYASTIASEALAIWPQSPDLLAAADYAARVS
ncbi:hypothetical protein BH10ACT2_BH10ACT2_11540 [soil metagenome]